MNALPPESSLREQKAKTTWEQLKLYLMLARPEHMDTNWFSSALLNDWQTRDGVRRRLAGDGSFSAVVLWRAAGCAP
ncbi:ImcF-related family protein [Enterobacter hormaechei]